MNGKIRKLLCGDGGNYIFPFLWLHGEDEVTLREYMGVIDESNIKAVCVESRPHPDYCGPKWWRDMDIILDEARKRGMKVWILDDSHFPTGFANGAMDSQPDALHRQSIVCTKHHVDNGETLHLSPDQLRHPKPFEKTLIERYAIREEPAQFYDDRLISLYAFRDSVGTKDFPAGFIRTDGPETTGGTENLTKPCECVDLKPFVTDGPLDWTPQEGAYTVYAIHASRNFGPHRRYINMMDAASCRVLIDAVYEPHYVHYAEDFGTTIAGFFSDEPELGNGHLYDYEDPFGSDMDYPWSGELEAAVQEALGAEYELLLTYLWRNDGDADLTARVRWQYMNAVTRLVQKDFSEQIGGWCREHGVQYIGHLIEDNNHHTRTGSSLGHYFRALSGQDMAGIDDIGGQVFPQGEDVSCENGMFGRRNGVFYHYTMGKLASSAAAIQPLKKGNAMCEIFGNYGWSEGVRLEKYLADHFMVRGVNHFVPHAFSPAPYPDPECPPHFYAHGHNPQYRHFGALMAYMNRVCELISDGRRIAGTAVIYNAEGDWTGSGMTCDPIVRALYDAQIDCDIIPQDVFAEPDAYKVGIADGMLRVNTQAYRMIFVPQARYITKEFAEAIPSLAAAGIPVYFAEGGPAGICNIAADASDDDKERIAAVKAASRVISIGEIAEMARAAGLQTAELSPADDRVRCLHYVHEDGTHLYYLVNEGTSVFEGTIRFTGKPTAGGAACIYDAWNNAVYDAVLSDDGMDAVLEPLKSLIVIFDPTGHPAGDSVDLRAETNDAILRKKMREGEPVIFRDAWKRSTCAAVDRPAFGKEHEVSLPDCLETEEPMFSGFVCYRNRFEADAADVMTLEITDAYEGTEVFLNGESLGLRIAPTCRYDLTGQLLSGVNELRIEVATTLERERSADPDPYGRRNEPTAASGIKGDVKLTKVLSDASSIR